MKTPNKPDQPIYATDEDKERINDEFQRDVIFKRKNNKSKEKFLKANA